MAVDSSGFPTNAPNRGRAFFEDVYAVVSQIPPGRVTSYGAIAEFLSLRGAARMVGYALNHVHGTGRNIPAHRVVNRNGVLTGKHHFGPPDEMQRRLEAEGVEVRDDTVQDFESRFWHPVRELQAGF